MSFTERVYYKELENKKLAQDPLNLRHFEQKYHSQNGEDGILAEIFRRIGTTNKYFVEFGVEDGLENNTRYLLQNEGWVGVWIEGSTQKAVKAHQTFAQFPVHILNRFIDRDNICSIFNEAQVPVEFDLLAIDLDGNDYWIWEALVNYSPRVVIIEYNGSFLPGQKWVMPYDSGHHWDGSNYFGASLDALYILGQQKGYRLVACDSQGVNAFFVRQDLLNDRFSHTDADTTYHYVSPKYNRRYLGHPSRQILENVTCWCGNRTLLPFSSGYLRCQKCETLVSNQAPETKKIKISEDDLEFYGRDYWFKHQETDLGYSNIVKRARIDLTERNLYWLQTLLKYRKPPARSLEIGCGHGGFLALMQWAGFNVTGLELNTWVVDFARQTFDVPVIAGPLEEQDIALESLDIIALMDVLEHLPDPVGTMRLALDLLAPNGLLFIQTPCYKEGKSLEAMLAENDRFLERLQANEHLYLFSQSSIRRFFEQLNAPYIQFEPAIFSYYDMAMLVSRSPISPLSPNVEEPLTQSPTARLVQASLDLQDQLQQANLDRQARLEVIHTLDKAYKTIEADRQARLENIVQLQDTLDIAEADRQTYIDQIADLKRIQIEQTARQQTQLNSIKAETAWWKEQAQQISAMRGVRIERWLRKLIFNRK